MFRLLPFLPPRLVTTPSTCGRVGGVLCWVGVSAVGVLRVCCDVGVLWCGCAVGV